MRNVQQFRPAGSPGAMMYSPQRDLANIYLPMMTEVYTGLSSEHLSELFRGWLDGKTTEEELAKAAVVLAEAHRLFIREPDVQSPADALDQAKAAHGEPCPQAMAILFARIGEVLMGGFFVAMRDVTLQGQPSTVHDAFVEMIAAGREFSQRLSGQLVDNDVTQAGKLAAEVEERSRILGQLQKQLMDAQTRIAELETELLPYRQQERANNGDTSSGSV